MSELPTTLEASRRRPVAGGFLVASALLSVLGYIILGTQFGWPAVLDEPADVALDAFVESERWVRAGFYVFLMSSLVLIPGAIALEEAITRGHSAARMITAFGVLGAFAQLLGWVRWPLTIPGVAERWSDPNANESDRAATAATYELINAYAGGALGEHLGWLLQGIWAIGVSVFVLKTRGLPRWFRLVGLPLAVGYGITVPLATALGNAGLEFWGLNIYSGWYVWLLVLGVLLIIRPVTPPWPVDEGRNQARVSS